MVGLHVVRHDVVNRGGVNDLPDIFDHLSREGTVHGIDQGRFFINDEIGVIRGPTMGRIRETMKVPSVPIDGSNPEDVFKDFDGPQNALHLR